MMLTTLALITILVSTLMVLSHLREVVSDTIQAIAVGTLRAQEDGKLYQRLSYVALWVLLFALSYF